MSNTCLTDFGCFQIQYFVSVPTDQMAKRLLSVPLRTVAESAVNRDGGQQVVNNALNVGVANLFPGLAFNGFRLTHVFKQAWKQTGICVGLFYNHERFDAKELELTDEVREALLDLDQSTWRYLHVWENRLDTGLLSVVAIDKSMRIQPERDLVVGGAHLNIVEHEVGLRKKAKFAKEEAKTMADVRRQLGRLRA